MGAAKVTFGSYDFGAAGVPQFGIQEEYVGDSAAHTTVRTTITVKQVFSEDNFSDNSSRIAELHAALQVAEGRLLIVDDAEQVIVDSVVRVKNSDLPQDWRQYSGEVNVVFEYQRVVAEDHGYASFTPEGGSPISLPNVTGQREGISTTRLSEERDARRITIGTISLSGKILADENASVADRRALLRGKAKELRGCDARHGVLKVGAEEMTVRVERVEADIGDGTTQLEWSLTATFQHFPDGEYAQAEFEVAERFDSVRAERRVGVSGSVRADTEARARAKIASIRASFGAGMSLVSEEVKPARFDVVDGTGFLGLTFSFEWRKTDDAALRWETKVTTKADIKNANNIITYEVTVTGRNSSAALAKAREVGKGRHSFATNSSEMVATTSREGEGTQFIEVVASYEYYVAHTEFRYAEVRTEIVNDPFGESRLIVSGYAAANTQNAATSLARSFRPAGIQREDRESATVAHLAGASSAARFERIDFQYVAYRTRTRVSVSYSIETTVDEETREQMRVVTGVARASSVAACESAITSIVSTGGGKRLRSQRNQSWERVDGSGYLVSVGFSETYRLSEGATAILEAEVTVTRVASVNRSILTEIPFGEPHVQQNAGRTIGRASVTGYCVADSMGRAVSWGRGKRGRLPSGGHRLPEEESETETYRDDLQTPVAHRFSFSYSAEYTNLT